MFFYLRIILLTILTVIIDILSVCLVLSLQSFKNLNIRARSSYLQRQRTRLTLWLVLASAAAYTAHMTFLLVLFVVRFFKKDNEKTQHNEIFTLATGFLVYIDPVVYFVTTGLFKWLTKRYSSRRNRHVSSSKGIEMRTISREIENILQNP